MLTGRVFAYVKHISGTYTAASHAGKLEHQPPMQFFFCASHDDSPANGFLATYIRAGESAAPVARVGPYLP